MKFCMKENVLYSICCKECRRKVSRVEYWGETGRDCFSRGEEHLKSCKDRCEDSPMWKHIWEVHEGSVGEEIFSMKMEMGFKSH